MIRGTTPTLEIKINGIGVSELQSIYITLSNIKIKSQNPQKISQ